MQRFSGVVVHGKGEGRRLGYPTANLEYDDPSPPVSGVWACVVVVQGERFLGVAVVGMWTLVEGRPSIEVHIPHQSFNLYDQRISLTLHEYLRPLQSFTSVEELKRQIEVDLERAEAWFVSYSDSSSSSPMFSGIVQGSYVVTDVTREGGLMRFSVDMTGIADRLAPGSSVSVSGVCLTVVENSVGRVVFEAIPETLERTTLCTLAQHDYVNIERSLRMGDEIGGHLVSGHVSGSTEIVRLEEHDGYVELVCRMRPEWVGEIFLKGFLAVDGCSLTVVDVNAETFMIHLIPETMRRTVFSKKRTGDRVNVEIDPMTRVIVQTTRDYLQHKTSL